MQLAIMRPMAYLNAVLGNQDDEGIVLYPDDVTVLVDNLNRGAHSKGAQPHDASACICKREGEKEKKSGEG